MAMMGDCVGSFINSFGKMTLSDPCYEKGIWCAQEINVKPGTWNAYIEKDSNNRVCFLSAVHDDFDTYQNFEIMGDSEELGVDSGQMCIWDSSDYDNGDVRYGEIGDGTLSEDAYYLGGHGIASLTKYGDGGYIATLFYESEDEDADVIAIEFDFN